VRRPKTGDEVEFVIFSNPSTRVVQAQEIRILPPGTVQFEQVSSKRLKAVVTEFDATAKQGGKLLHKEEDGGGTSVLPFAAADISDPRYLVLKGGSIEYSVACDKHSGDRRAVLLTPLPLEAVVASIDSKGAGSLRISVEVPGLEDPVVSFDASEVDKGDQGKLEEGTDVHVYLSQSADTYVAHKVKRFFKMREPEKMPEHMKRNQDMVRRTERLAGGPVPGSRGFQEPMTRTPAPDYPPLGGKLPKTPTFNVEAAEFVVPT